MFQMSAKFLLSPKKSFLPSNSLITKYCCAKYLEPPSSTVNISILGLAQACRSFVCEAGNSSFETISTVLDSVTQQSCAKGFCSCRISTISKDKSKLFYNFSLAGLNQILHLLISSNPVVSLLSVTCIFHVPTLCFCSHIFTGTFKCPSKVIISSIYVLST